MANCRPNRIWAGLLRLALALLAPITIAVTPVVPSTTATGNDDEHERAADPVPPPGRARGPPSPTVAMNAAEAPDPIHPPAREEELTTPVRPPPPRHRKHVRHDTPKGPRTHAQTPRRDICSSPAQVGNFAEQLWGTSPSVISPA